MSLVSCWDYDHNSDAGPEHWCDRFPQAKGHKQSPIDISGTCARYDTALKEVKFHFNYHPGDITTVKNTGTSFQLMAKENCNSTFSAPGYLKDEYRLLQAHFHWGPNSKEGSEHTVNGNSYAGEMHIVHMNKRYASMGEASQHQDGIAVVGVFIEEVNGTGDDNELFAQLLEKIPYKSDTAAAPSGFDLRSLLPRNKEFWAYEGSLTTPPCTECVLWTVFHHPIHLSTREFTLFRKLYMVDQCECMKKPRVLNTNHRPCQALDHRNVRASFNC